MKASLEFEIDWLSEEPHILSAEKNLKPYHDHQIFSEPGVIWLKTSGTTSQKEKWLGLKKAAILSSAQSVNRFINSNADDIWLNILPLHHIGGLSILARSFLSGAKAYHRSLKPWSPSVFFHQTLQTQATLISLVPTQIYDLIQAQIKCPKTVRAVFVGGGYLSKELYQKARCLGWPILITYGMTEMSSQVATAPLESLKQSSYPEMQILPHIEYQLTEESILQLKGPSMFSYKVTVAEKNIDIQKSDYFYTTEDQVEIHKQNLVFKKRISDRIKVLGYLVDIHQLNKDLSAIITQKNMDPRSFIIQSMKHPRRDNDVILFFADYHFKQVQKLVMEFNQQLKNSEKIQRIYHLNKLKITDLGKIKNQWSNL